MLFLLIVLSASYTVLYLNPDTVPLIDLFAASLAGWNYDGNGPRRLCWCESCVHSWFQQGKLRCKYKKIDHECYTVMTYMALPPPDSPFRNQNLVYLSYSCHGAQFLFINLTTPLSCC